MKIKLIAVGTHMPSWVEAGYQDYCQRIVKPYSLELHEIRLRKRTSHADVKRFMEAEGAEMLGKIGHDDKVIALDVLGKAWSTEELADKLQQWRQEHSAVTLLVGGPEGLAPEAYAKASERWSLSRLTLPHPLVRVIVAEQIYRAISILGGHPYHR